MTEQSLEYCNVDGRQLCTTVNLMRKSSNINDVGMFFIYVLPIIWISPKQRFSEQTTLALQLISSFAISPYPLSIHMVSDAHFHGLRTTLVARRRFEILVAADGPVGLLPR